MKIMLHSVFFTIIALTKLYNCCTIDDINWFANTYVVKKVTYETIPTNYPALKIINNNTTVLSSKIFEHTNNFVEYLDSSNGTLETIKSFTFENINLYLAYLLFNNNHISNLEPNAFNSLYKLQYLDLSQNNISRTNIVFNDLTRLCYLNISNNQIENINLTGIQAENIDLSYNYLRNISIFDNAKLKYLNLTFNKLSTIFLNKTDNLQSLDLSNNQIKILPIFFNKTENLTSLDLSNNQIKVLPIGTFYGLKSLKRLMLSNNQLKSFKFGSFMGLSTLVTLDLSYNKLIDMQLNKLMDLNNLNILNISFNQIDSIDSKIFIYLKSLTKLILDGNKMYYDGKQIIENILCKNFSRCDLKTISLGQNSQTCYQLANDILSTKENGITVTSIKKTITKSSIYEIECLDTNL